MTTPPNHNTADQSGADRLQKIVDGLNSCGMHLWAQELQAALASTQPAPETAQKVIAWVRFRSDGGYEGPIMDGSRDMCDIRRLSGAWTPLYATPQPFHAPAVQSGELPELPDMRPIPGFYDIEERGQVRFTADQMRDYARKAIAAQTARQEPVAWISYDTVLRKERIGRMPIQSLQPGVYKHTPLYAAPPTQAIAVEAGKEEKS